MSGTCLGKGLGDHWGHWRRGGFMSGASPGGDMGTLGSVGEVAHIGGFPGAETWAPWDTGAEGGYHQGFLQ